MDQIVNRDLTTGRHTDFLCIRTRPRWLPRFPGVLAVNAMIALRSCAHELVNKHLVLNAYSPFVQQLPAVLESHEYRRRLVQCAFCVFFLFLVFFFEHAVGITDDYDLL
jgi:hypothetical protein